MNTITLQFVIQKRVHSRAGSPGKTLIDITVKVNYSCTVSDMPFNCQDGGSRGREGRWDGAGRWRSEVEQEVFCAVQTSHCHLHTANCTLHTSHCTLHTAHFTLHSSHCTLQGTCPSQTTWSPYCWLLSHSCMRTWESSCCFSRYTLHSTLIPPQAPQP